MSDGQKIVGIAGLGLIGIALARRLLAAGYEVYGYDVDPKRNALLGEIGGRPCASLRELGGRCKTILIAVLTTEQVESVVEGAEKGGPMGLGRGHVLVSVSTADPDRIAALAARVTPGGVGFLEFPISGNSDQIILGNGVGMSGGERATLEAVAPVLELAREGRRSQPRRGLGDLQLRARAPGRERRGAQGAFHR